MKTYREYEEYCGYPQTEAEYRAYLRINFKEELQENDDSEERFNND